MCSLGFELYSRTPQLATGTTASPYFCCRYSKSGFPSEVTQRRLLPQPSVKALENTQGRLGSRKPFTKSA